MNELEDSETENAIDFIRICRLLENCEFILEENECRTYAFTLGMSENSVVIAIAPEWTSTGPSSPAR